MDSFPINPFDAAVYVCLAVAVLAGFNAGLLRSLASIFGYVAAMAVAVIGAPKLVPLARDQLHLAPDQNWIVLVALFLVAGILIGAMLRYAVSEIVGPDISPVDRLLGAFFGAVRVAFLALLIVLIFDKIIPAGREPTFLAGSKLRPLLSQAARAGLQSLPPDIEDYIDRLKRERGL
jgi:membrane protein required for colicin V production